MKIYTKEFIVGLFILAGLGILLYSSIILSSGGMLISKSYSVKGVFTNVSGLQYGTPVRIAGVPVGSVQKIMLANDGTMAQVTFSIKDGVKLPEDTIAVIKTSGLLGEKYVQLLLGSSNIMVQNNGELFETQAPLDIEDLIGKFVFGSTNPSK